MSKHLLIISFITFFLVFCLSLFINTSSVFALDNPPQFPSCLNPLGTLISSFSSGVHGIPGNVESFSGSDSVYSVSQNSLIQCFCPSNDSGIQTNWWKISDLSVSDIESFKALGWILIPSGSAWGLDASPYLTMNIGYSCLPTGNSGGGGGGGSSSSGSSSSGGSSGGGGGSSSSQSPGEILGLAFTGNILYIYGLVSFGLICLFLGLALKKLSSKIK